MTVATETLDEDVDLGCDPGKRFHEVSGVLVVAHVSLHKKRDRRIARGKRLENRRFIVIAPAIGQYAAPPFASRTPGQFAKPIPRVPPVIRMVFPVKSMAPAFMAGY